MSKLTKALSGLALAAAVAAFGTYETRAQCTTSREFGGLGNGNLTGRVIIDTTTHGFPNDGNELLSIWDAAHGSAGFGSGDHIATNPGACPNSGGTTGWYFTGTMFLGADAGIRGFIGSPGCFEVQCPMPGEFFSTLVEDENGASAGFILYTVDNTPAGIRPYDHARTDGIDDVPSAVAIHTLLPYPTIVITAVSGVPPNQTITVDYSDPGSNYHGAGVASSPTTSIQSFDIVAHHGPVAPGRMRASYNLGTVRKIPYTGSGVAGDMFVIPCPTPFDETFLAVGLTFVDPSTGGIKSRFVGPHVAGECETIFADPDAPSLRHAAPPTGASLDRAKR